MGDLRGHAARAQDFVAEHTGLSASTSTAPVAVVDRGGWAQANADAALCWDCIQQADRAFAKDPDTDWDRKISPTNRWR